MALYFPIKQTPLALQKFFENLKLAQLFASGIISFGEYDSLTKEGGEYINIPVLVHGADFAHVDVESSTPITFTRAAGLDQKAVILRDTQANSFTEADLIRTGEDLDSKLAATAGEKLAKRVLQQFARVAEAAIDAIDSPTANCHTHAGGNNNLTVAMIAEGKNKLGDASDVLTTIFLHSKAFKNLYNDLRTTYAVPNVMGDAVLKEELSSILGISNVIKCDLATNTGVGTGSAGDDVYSSLLLGPNAFQYGMQKEFRGMRWDDIKNPSPMTYVRVMIDYYLHPAGFAWGGGANPTDADYGGANWTMRVSDHRSLPMAKITHNAS